MSNQRSEAWRRAARITLNVALTLACALMSLLYCGIHLLGSEPASPGTQVADGPAAAVLGCLVVAAGLITAIWFRARAPLALTMTAAACAIVLPLDSTVALAGATCLVHRRRGPAVWAGVAAALAATAWSFARDVLNPVGHSMAGTFLSSGLPAGAHLGWNAWAATAVALALAAACVIGGGLLLRSGEELAASRAQADQAQAESASLTSEMARLAEREQIAREVHDSLGHDLSLISLQAAALELDGAAGTQATEAARSLRATAQEAHKSLSSLVDALRNPPEAPDPHAHVEAAPGLGQLAGLLRESSDHGMALSAVVMLSQTSDLDEASGRAVYRIVQEALTNARRHAPGQPVRLELTGREPEGLFLCVTNPLPETAGHFTPGNGLTGMGERVQLAGGTLSAGPTEDGQFAVSVTLPWRGAS